MTLLGYAETKTDDIDIAEPSLETVMRVNFGKTKLHSVLSGNKYNNKVKSLISKEKEHPICNITNGLSTPTKQTATDHFPLSTKQLLIRVRQHGHAQNS
ncbi:unnamed protein product [Nezara viridula]|uniref:Uncharacterized protein n=1 Tax=Nezara viridula TaxID=85310 RepID=A0A9P0HIS0_NEZVI|nr:unnamed protein product [Nezara viridula]